MTLTIPLVCLLLGWNDPIPTPAARAHAPKHAPAGVEGVVIQVRSGVEIVVKTDDEVRDVRLLGIETPKGAPSVKVDELNQTKFLRQELKFGEKVRLFQEAGKAVDADHHMYAHVLRSSDNRWVNLDLLEQGFATVSETYVGKARPDFLAAEKAAKADKRGMWAPDFLVKAAKPTPFKRIKIHHAATSVFAGSLLGGGAVESRPRSSEDDNDKDDDKDDQRDDDDTDSSFPPNSSGQSPQPFRLSKQPGQSPTSRAPSQRRVEELQRMVERKKALIEQRREMQLVENQRAWNELRREMQRQMNVGGGGGGGGGGGERNMGGGGGGGGGGGERNMGGGGGGGNSAREEKQGERREEKGERREEKDERRGEKR